MHLNFTCLSHNAAYSKSSQFWIFDIISDFSKEHPSSHKTSHENRPTQELGCLYKKRTQTFCWQKNFVFATKLDSFNALDETNTHTHNFCAKNFVFIWLFRVHFYFQLSFFFQFLMMFCYVCVNNKH